MSRRPDRWMAWIGVALIVGCQGGNPAIVGNTEVNVIVPNGAPSLGGGSSAPGRIDIQSVEYTIHCLGNDDTFLESNQSFPDEVRLEGNLEVVDGQTNPDFDPPAPNPPGFGTPRPGDGAEVWQAFMDLPPGPCTIQLRARDDDGEVICTATEPFTITADTLAKVNLVLVCDVSFQAPVGMLDVDATFSFLVSNFCPDLFVLNCLETNPVEQIIAPGLPPVAVTTCEVRFRDGDSQCGESCDPRSCVVTPEGLDCFYDPDGNNVDDNDPSPTVSTTVTCSNAQIDCDFNPLTTETECVFSGDTLGVTPVAGPVVPNAPGAGAFAVACIPPGGAPPGGTVVCTAVTTDGDEDCNKTKTVSVNCGYEEPCWQFAADSGFPADTAGADAACQALASTVCVQSVCDETRQVGGSCAGGICCVDIPVADGTDCSAELPPLAECIGGACSGTCCVDDAACDDGNECTTDTCDIVSCLCINDAAPNDGNACQPDASCAPTDGTCAAGVCEGNDQCTVAGDCPNNPLVPADPACTAALCVADVCGDFCDIDLGANAGSTCDFIGPGTGDGTCLPDGTCLGLVEGCNFVQTGSELVPQTAVVRVACTNSVTLAQSTLPFTLEVDVPGPIISGFPFDAAFDGIGVFPELFLDAAQGLVPGGTTAVELVDIVATVQIRSGATGPDVPLVADLGSLTPGLVQLCNFPPDQVCTTDGECLGGVCNPPIVLASVPTSSDCGAGGVCDALGKTGTGSQCLLNGFCVTGDLPIELQSSGFQTFTATGPSGSDVLFGWADGAGAGTSVPGLFLCPAPAPNCQEPFMPDGCYDLPPAVFNDPAGPIGIRVVAPGFPVPIQCAMAEPGGICASGEGCLVDADCATAPCTPTTDVVCPTPDANLIGCFID